MRDQTNVRSPADLSNLRTWRQGADLALELLEEADLGAMALNRRDRDDGRPHQDNLLLRYLLRLRRVDDARVEAAFCAVLTDFIASCRDGGVPDVSLLRRLSRKPVATSVAPRAETA